MVLSPVSNRLAVVVSKSSCSESSAIIIAIVSQRFHPWVMAKRRHLQRYFTSAKICITGFLYPFSLVILG